MRSLLLVAGCLVATASPALGQTRTVIGRVLDALTGDPIALGRVSVKGHDMVDRLRADGVFVLHVPDEAITIVVEGPGYRAREIEIARHDEAVLIPLSANAVELAPVVYAAGATDGSARAARLDGAPSSNVLEAMQGKLAGVDIQRNSGAPGGSLQFRLRGISTILGPVAPLYVLDGVILSNASITSGASSVTGGQASASSRIADLNPADIESIEILKGPQAAMYGSRGANGVVLIRTRRGNRQ